MPHPTTAPQPWIRRLAPLRVRLWPALVLAALPSIAPSLALAQLNVLAPTFANLNGAAVWGSLAYRRGDGPHVQGDDRAISRIGFAAFYGPFGGRGDSLVTFTQSVTDSSDTTLCDRSQVPSYQVRRRIRSHREVRVDSRRLGGGGKVTLVVGYQHSTSYRFGSAVLPDQVTVGGAFIATLLGPYRVPFASPRVRWYGGVGGTVVRLSEQAGRADTLALQINTERTLAPEANLMVMVSVAPGYRVFLGAGYQVLRFGSLTYREVERRQIPAAIAATLPDHLALETLHFSLGFSFAANGLIPGR